MRTSVSVLAIGTRIVPQNQSFGFCTTTFGFYYVILSRGTLGVLRLCQFLKRSLTSLHGYTETDAENCHLTEQFNVLPVLFRSQRCKEKICAEGEIGKALLSGMRPEQVRALLCCCRQLYDEAPPRQHFVHGARSTDTAQERFGKDIKHDDIQEWCQTWLSIIHSNSPVPPPRELRSLASPQQEQVNFEAWCQMVLPTMNVHLRSFD